jgi:hypothetical protein
MLKEKAAPAEQALREHLSDGSPAVSLWLASALVHLGKMEVALPVFERALQPSTPAPYLLQAANVLMHLREAALPALPLMKDALARAEIAHAEAAAAEKNPHRYPRDLLKRTVDELEGKAERLVYPKPAASL